jgi:hypothetical protein
VGLDLARITTGPGRGVRNRSRLLVSDEKVEASIAFPCGSRRSAAEVARATRRSRRDRAFDEGVTARDGSAAPAQCPAPGRVALEPLDLGDVTKVEAAAAPRPVRRRRLFAAAVLHHYSFEPTSAGGSSRR